MASLAFWLSCISCWSLLVGAWPGAQLSLSAGSTWRLFVNVQLPLDSGNTTSPLRMMLDSGSSNLGICSHTVQSAVQATKTQFTTCISYADIPTPYFTGGLELGNIVVGAPDAGQAGSVGAAPEVFDNVGFTIMSNSSMEAFHMCGNKANFYDGIFGIGGINTKTGSFDVYNANQYTPSQLAKYIQEQAHNKTAYATCPAGRLQNVMPNFGPLPYKLTTEGADEHHIGIYWNGKDGSSTGSMFLGDKALGNQYYNSSTDNALEARMFNQGFYSMYAERVGVCGPGESFPDGCTWSNPSTVAEASSVSSSAATPVPPSKVRHEDAVAAAASSSTRGAKSVTVVILDTGTPFLQLPKDILDRAALLFYGNALYSASDDVTIYLELQKEADSKDFVILKIDAAMLFSRTKFASVYPSTDITNYEPNCIFDTYGYCSVVGYASFPNTVLPDKTIVQTVLFGRSFWNGFYTVFSYEDGNVNGTVTLMAKPYEALGPPLPPNYFRQGVEIVVVVVAVAFIIGFVISGIIVGVMLCSKKKKMEKQTGLDEDPQQQKHMGYGSTHA